MATFVKKTRRESWIRSFRGTESSTLVDEESHIQTYDEDGTPKEYSKESLEQHVAFVPQAAGQPFDFFLLAQVRNRTRGTGRQSVRGG